VTVQPEKRAKGSIKGEIAEFKRKQILDAAVELFLRNGDPQWRLRDRRRIDPLGDHRQLAGA
jgi:hypothetical protein